MLEYSLIITNRVDCVLFPSLILFEMKELSVIVPILEPLSLSPLGPPNFLL